MIQPAGTVQVYDVAPVIATKLYVYEPPLQTVFTGPVIVPGTAGTERTVTVLFALVPQADAAATETDALTYDAGAVKLMLFVPCPLLIVQPAGTVQTYDVAPVTAGQEYVPVEPPHTPLVVPVIEDGVPGLLYNANVLAALVPIQLDAVTLTLPDVKAAPKLTVAVVLPCPLMILAFAGAVQV
jgi:hypothetical protein